MGYDEKIFKAKANIKARRLWLVFAILLTANYGTDTANGAYSVSNYIIFVILCWLPFVCGDILLKRKGKDNDHYRLTFVIGYGIFYVFLLCTTTSPIAFTYILPIISLIVIFKDEKFMIYCAVANMLSLIASIVFHILVLGQNTAVDHKNFQLQIACLLLCYIGYIMSVRHLTESDAALTESIKSDLNRVVTTVEQVKTASNTIMDGITVKMSTLNSTFFHVFIVLPFCTIRSPFYCIFSLLGSAVVRLPLLPASHAPCIRCYASCFTSSLNNSPAEW